MIAPTIDALAAEYAGRARVGKLNVDQNGEVAERYGVSAIPTLLLFREGRVVDQRREGGDLYTLIEVEK